MSGNKLSDTFAEAVANINDSTAGTKQFWARYAASIFITANADAILAALRAQEVTAAVPGSAAAMREAVAKVVATENEAQRGLNDIWPGDEIDASPPPDTRDGEIAELRVQIKDYEEVLTDKCRLTRELDVAMNGEDGVAKQASLCDLIEPAKALHSAVATAKEALVKAKCTVKVLADGVYNDNGEMTVEKPLVTYDQCCNAYFAEKTIDEALAALDAAKGPRGT